MRRPAHHYQALRHVLLHHPRVLDARVPRARRLEMFDAEVAARLRRSCQFVAFEDLEALAANADVAVASLEAAAFGAGREGGGGGGRSGGSGGGGNEADLEATLSLEDDGGGGGGGVSEGAAAAASAGGGAAAAAADEDARVVGRLLAALPDLERRAIELTVLGVDVPPAADLQQQRQQRRQQPEAAAPAPAPAPAAPRRRYKRATLGLQRAGKAMGLSHEAARMARSRALQRLSLAAWQQVAAGGGAAEQLLAAVSGDVSVCLTSPAERRARDAAANAAAAVATAEAAPAPAETAPRPLAKKPASGRPRGRPRKSTAAKSPSGEAPPGGFDAPGARVVNRRPRWSLQGPKVAPLPDA